MTGHPRKHRWVESRTSIEVFANLLQGAGDAEALCQYQKEEIVKLEEKVQDLEGMIRSAKLILCKQSADHDEKFAKLKVKVQELEGRPEHSELLTEKQRLIQTQTSQIGEMQNENDLLKLNTKKLQKTVSKMTARFGDWRQKAKALNERLHDANLRTQRGLEVAEILKQECDTA